MTRDAGVSAGFVSPALTLICAWTGPRQLLASLWCHRWEVTSGGRPFAPRLLAEGGLLPLKTAAYLYPRWFVRSVAVGDDAMQPTDGGGKW